jgi:NADH:ubiquinone oxidoreductase subunit F (NADH-binding)
LLRYDRSIIAPSSTVKLQQNIDTHKLGEAFNTILKDVLEHLLVMMPVMAVKKEVGDETSRGRGRAASPTGSTFLLTNLCLNLNARVCYGLGLLMEEFQ